jgi:hypothetical protein
VRLTPNEAAAIPRNEKEPSHARDSRVTRGASNRGNDVVTCSWTPRVPPIHDESGVGLRKEHICEKASHS